MKRFILLCALLASCGSADEANMMLMPATGGGGGAGAGAGAGGATASTGGSGGAIAPAGGSGGGGQGGDSASACRFGIDNADFWLEGGAKTCVQNNAGYNVSLIPKSADCTVPMVVVSMNVVPVTAAGAVHDSNGNIIETSGSSCFNKALAPHESCSVQLGQLDEAIGTRGALVVCTATADGKVAKCTTFPPC